jgi:hypothetical protein
VERPAGKKCNGAPGNNAVRHYFASRKMVPCLVLSHSCELEKPKERSRIHVAPMMPLTKFPEHLPDG